MISVGCNVVDRPTQANNVSSISNSKSRQNTEQTAAKQYTVCLNENAPTLASGGFHMQINFNKF